MKKVLSVSVFFFALCFNTFGDLFHPLQLVKNQGNTLIERIATPFNFQRITSKKGSFAHYIQNYPLKPADSPLLLFNGIPKENQNCHAAIFTLPLDKSPYQNDSSAIIRLYAEYMYKMGMEDKIKFHFINGEISAWKDWLANAQKSKSSRIQLAGNLKKWTKYEAGMAPSKKEIFQKYLDNLLKHTDILSMQIYESQPTTFEQIEIGDLLWDLGKDGRLCMVVDICQNPKSGEKAVLLAQGASPAQEFHILKNPKRINDPWYYEEDFNIPTQTPEYTFPKDSWRKVLYLNNQAE